MKPKATTADLYDRLSFQEWKTGLEMIYELENMGFRAGHFRGVMYIHFNKWEEHGLIKSQKRENSKVIKAVQRAAGYPIPRQSEYLRVATGTPEDLKNQTGLEGCLAPVHA